uniref:Uncharacterized protein n=1 Tax=Chrysemys picta bellii TaxID=8478 RepID=A0A8C3IA31_CHRPI
HVRLFGSSSAAGPSHGGAAADCGFFFSPAAWGGKNPGAGPGSGRKASPYPNPLHLTTTLAVSAFQDHMDWSFSYPQGHKSLQKNREVEPWFCPSQFAELAGCRENTLYHSEQWCDMCRLPDLSKRGSRTPLLPIASLLSLLMGKNLLLPIHFFNKHLIEKVFISFKGGGSRAV